MSQRLEAFFSYGFRPFFLFAALHGAASIFVWILFLATAALDGPTFSALPPAQWHGHEMVFGFATAVIAGFFLTAVPNWTNTDALKGRLLAALAVLWLAGRAAVWLSGFLPPVVTAVVDLAFTPALAAVVVVALTRGGSKRNLVFLPVLALLFAGGLLGHLEYAGVTADTAAAGLRTGLAAVILLITIVGGRVVPAFTTNALRNRGEERLPVKRPPLDIAAIAAVAAMTLAEAFSAEPPIVGGLALAGGLLNLARLAGWRGVRTVDSPILWVLHLGFLMLGLGLLLRGATLLGGAADEATSLHLLAIGAVGLMTTGVMSRASLGHTGRPLVAARPVVFVYWMVVAAALVRVAGPYLAPSLTIQAAAASGVLWSLAFAVFAVHHWPMLTRPRLRPGAERRS